MTRENPATQYAPAQRSDTETILRQKESIDQYLGPLRQLYDSAVSEIFLIVNQNRQIVFFNAGFPALTGADDPQRLYGMRPGEAMDCTNACRNSGGCGTSEFCSQCGGVQTMLSALDNRPDIRECRILRRQTLEAIEMLVRSTPLTIGQERFSIVAIQDISHEKRRRALERVFFHDVMNTAESIRMFAGMLDSDADGGNSAGYRQHLLTGVSQLTEQLQSQRTLLSAENNELEVKKAEFDGYALVLEVTRTLGSRFSEHEIRVDAPDTEMTLKTDRGLLRRVLENMVLNALEASRSEQTVHVSCGIKNDCAEFRVHNRTPIPRENQLQIFQRSFSTKGPGRGLGTYSMKLLSQRYLNGRVEFTSSADHGTTFIARYPL
ncbi:MAG: sensor histidine kinase [Desulfobacteraceae bacterium]|nr:sensor histidine kinase [Desulfobacteraceae bacterium]